MITQNYKEYIQKFITNIDNMKKLCILIEKNYGKIKGFFD